MPDSTWIKIIIASAAIVWLFISILMDLPVDISLLRPLGIASSIVVFGVMFFDSFMWRWLPYSITHVPNLRGTWQAELNSSHKENGKAVKLTCYLAIRQTYSKITVEVIFPKSESESTVASLVKDSGTTELWYSYRSKAHSLSRKDNPPHIGTASLRISGHKKIKLSGDYWTDRSSEGRIVTKAHHKSIVNDYEEAEGLFNPKR